MGKKETSDKNKTQQVVHGILSCAANSVSPFGEGETG